MEPEVADEVRGYSPRTAFQEEAEPEEEDDEDNVSGRAISRCHGNQSVCCNHYITKVDFLTVSFKERWFSA